MFTRFDATKSTKGASKLRRDLINTEIANLRDLLPLPPSTRQRLSQLQLMALVCVYIRKANYFQQAFKRKKINLQHVPPPNIGFSKALSGFLIMMTQNGKLLYISDNAAEYLGHSMEDLLIHGDSVYDIIDKQDHQVIQEELGRTTSSAIICSQDAGNPEMHSDVIYADNDRRIFLCRMNVSRNARRQMRFGDQKVVLIKGQFVSFLPLCSKNEPVFLATCTPIAMPETRECVVHGATTVFTSIHSMDMKFIYIDNNGEFYLEYTKCEIKGLSWYLFLHWECIREAQTKHRAIVQGEQDKTGIVLIRLQRRSGDWLWIHCVLQVKENVENTQAPVIVCTNQVLTENEALVMYTNGWFYHYFMVQSKIQYGLAVYKTQTSPHILTYYSQDHKNMQGPANNMQRGLGQSSDEKVNPYTFPQNIRDPAQDNISYGNNRQLQHQDHSGPQCTDSEPVDYSVNANSTGNEDKLSIYLYSSTPTSKLATIPLYSKRRLRHMTSVSALDLEPLKISGKDHEPLSNFSLTNLEHPFLPGSTSSGDTLCVPSATIPLSSLTLQYALAKSRFSKKASTSGEPPEIMEEWNPSPPWSDTLQRVPDISHQELSPYVRTEPPTPAGTPSMPRATSTKFIFDWPAEQYVPNMNAPNAKPVANPEIGTSECDSISFCQTLEHHNQSSLSPTDDMKWHQSLSSTKHPSNSE